MTTLLDGSVLVALAGGSHVHHQAARHWFAALEGAFATCPITQGTLLRLALTSGATTREARAVLTGVVENERHEFWADDIGYLRVSLNGVVGHRQLTNAYLAGLARAHGGSLATFDRGLAALHSDVARLVSRV